MNRKLLLRTAAALLIVIFLTGCSGKNAKTEATKTPDETASAAQGETKRYTYQNFEAELTNVKGDRTESMKDDAGNDYKYTVVTLYPGAKLTIIKADMSDPAYSEDGKAYPNWGILQADDKRIKITEDTQTLDVTSDMKGIYSLEASLFIFRFEYME